MENGDITAAMVICLGEPAARNSVSSLSGNSLAEDEVHTECMAEMVTCVSDNATDSNPHLPEHVWSIN